jgi:hypothetical protein
MFDEMPFRNFACSGYFCCALGTPRVLQEQRVVILGQTDLKSILLIKLHIKKIGPQIYQKNEFIHQNLKL